MKYLKYSDVALMPTYSEVNSRLDCDPSLDLFGKKFLLPIIPANMKSVINLDLSSWMSENDYFYIMHRFNNDIYAQIEQANLQNWKTISFSVGVQDKDKTIINKLRTNKLRLDFLTIDIAHGHSIKMKRMIAFIKENLPNAKIIAGNVATPEAVKALASWGADIVKVGIGQGSPCTTKSKTGFTVPMFTCVQNCSGLYSGEFNGNGEEIPIIADGGVKHNGDIAKAIVAGSKMVMAGGLFAACVDSPAVHSSVHNTFYKAYFGSASAESKGHKNNIEGKLTNIPCNNMTIEEKLREVTQDLQSSISYSGGNALTSLYNTEYIKT